MVAIGNAVEAVAGGRGKAQPAGQLLAVDFIRRPRQRAAAQRANVQTLQGILKTALVTGQHLNVGQAPVGKRHRLRALQVSIARHHCVLIRLRRLNQRTLQLTVSHQQLCNGIFAPQLQVSRHLIVTATAGVQLFTQLTHFVDQLAFYPAMDIFSIAFQNLLRIGANLFQQHAQRAFQLRLFVSGQHANRHQRFGPGNRANDILLRQAIIKA